MNFQMVDTDKDGTTSAAEFNAGCSRGWVQSADAFNHQRDEPAVQALGLDDAA